MAIILTPAERKAVSRRLVKLPQEIIILGMTSDNLSKTEAAFSAVDAANREFLAHWLNIANRYLDEREGLNGQQYDTFNQGGGDDFDCDRAFITDPTLNIFYPKGHATLPDNYYLIPSINTYTNSAPNGSMAANYETVLAKNFQMLIYTLMSGTTGGANTSVSGSYSGGNTLTVLSGAGISNDSCVIVSGVDGGAIPHQYLFYVQSGGGTNTLTGWAVCGGPGTIIAAGSAVRVGGGIVWSDAVRNNLSGAAPYNLLSAAIVTYMTSADATWEGVLTAEEAALTANDDARTTQQAQNTAAIAAINDLQAVIDVWQLLPNTDAGGNSKFNNPGLTALGVQATPRPAFVTTRVSQINTALGSVTDNGDGTYTTVAGAAASKYRWLDRRLNKSQGSFASEDNTAFTKNIIDQQLSNSVEMEADYNTVMNATALDEEPDGTASIIVKDVSLFDAGDTVYIWDDADPASTEITGYIVGIHTSLRRVDLSFNVPATYTTDNLARMYKIL